MKILLVDDEYDLVSTTLAERLSLRDYFCQ